MDKDKKYSMDFGKKERLLNLACQTYHLSRPPKVGEVMALIRECQPRSLEEWRDWYFGNAYTKAKTSTKVTLESLRELGERLYVKIKTIVIPDWQEAFATLTEQDCIDYIYNLTINRTYDGYLSEKFVINDVLAKIFPDIVFEASEPELDHSGDVDYTARVGEKAIGIQIKPVTANANFGGYSLSERMKASFESFKQQYGGEVFIVYSVEKKIANMEVIDRIRTEINRLRSSQ